ncbi:SDR family NAD(P)-dependent oxidoreductase [Candidatus Nitrosotalea bavarica]|uniref:SDR family NAD(P)-dependent oxidoreductase n=1 Tax=Candidatus Nitrosotalea bavarica TaxID=1903277 RepID=UPI000C710E9E|nr:SDR family NAD(P)-dependent oxidoreductase [Candidatus Nitrosotalea bavarica]
MKLSGKVAIVTGGSRGIGKSTAILLAQHGADVVITSKDKTNLENAVKEIKNAIAIVGDIRKRTDVENVVKSTLEHFGKIDILVNNAGIFPKVKPLHEISEEEWNEVIDVNLTGQFRFTKAVIPHLMKTGGCIVNVSSNAGLKSFENFEADAYTASKGALVLLTKAWAIEYAKYKIRVNCVCPGIVETDMTQPYLGNEIDRSMAVAEHPIGRIGVPEDVAKAILYLVSEDSSWITGAILPIDGGSITK